MNKKILAITCIMLLCASVMAQDFPIHKQKFIFFPYPMQRKWVTSIGFNATTMPYEITEELHYRIPAIDFHVVKKLPANFSLDGRINAQVLQNLVSIGPKWAGRLSDRISFSLGDDVGFWFGRVTVQGFQTHGRGWQNYPNASLGYRFNKRILLTLRADAIITNSVQTYAGKTPVATTYKTFSGSSYTVAIEQPFYGKKSITLGFRAIYTSFFWQTWTAFTNFNRDFFYPQLIVGLIL